MKNYIARPQHIDITIKRDDDSSMVGHFRITPASVKWADGDGKKYYSIPLDKFIAWITDENTGAKRVDH